MQDPEMYLEALGVTLPCAMVEGEDAVLDPAYRSFVNHEIYFFSTKEQKEIFDTDPQDHCGLITDPVSRVRFSPTKASPRQDYMMRPYFFESTDTHGLFAATPDSFAVPRLRMVPKSEEGE